MALLPNPADVLYDFSKMRVYTDDRVERLAGKDVVPVELDAETGVLSKEVVISMELNISARLYLSKTSGTDGWKLPILVYFHGGRFMIESAFSPTYQKNLNLVAAEANVVIASGYYRLAPEHPLPVVYGDSWLALESVASHSHLNRRRAKTIVLELKPLEQEKSEDTLNQSQAIH